jgi:hypothetical protein
MENTTRRMFCGTALTTLSALSLVAAGKDRLSDNLSNSSEPVLEALADEFANVIADGAQKQFKSDHFRRYASLIRMLDMQMECRGINGEVDKRLDDDDFHRMDYVRSARFVSEFWRKRNLYLQDEGLNFNEHLYREGKKRIKKMGGVRALSAQTSLLFEMKARQYENAAFRGGPYMRQGKILLPNQPEKALFVNAQYFEPFQAPPDLDTLLYNGGFSSLDPNLINLLLCLIDMPANAPSPLLDCFCSLLLVMGSVLILLGTTFLCTPCWIAGSMWILKERTIESMMICNPHQC